MIIDFLLLTANAVVFVLYQVFKLLSFVLPYQIKDMITYWVSYLGYVKGFFDVNTFLLVLGIYINFLILLYTFKVVKWVYAHLPWIGRHKELPHMASSKGHK